MNLAITKPVLLSAALVLVGGLASMAVANHKTNNPPIDVAMIGTNVPGWTSEGECANDRPGQGCQILTYDCGGYDVYTTQAIHSMVKSGLQEGQKMPVHTMTDSGHFVDKICTLIP
ncbi:hypothetical protein MACH17_06250 [Phaeobacter inhibens]|uniref:hypothetical protein n=1 Tax=Phaeobacter inhibens TaxID=221822 RepID=UPI00275BA718|nr:hypothetical protein [Phaeobacter inhibens]GLO69108.1 hypothetical protein MACH17_06250 [Phaeobacter inhibens]